MIALSRKVLAVCVPMALGLALVAAGPASAAGVRGSGTVPPGVTGVADPAPVLGAHWRASKDRVVTVEGDATGLHVLVAAAAEGYAWRNIATLAVPGASTSQWIGQACLTAGGQRAVVVYAPRQVTNQPDALGYGALAAVVDLSTGRVTPLDAGVSIAYFDPGCGAGQDALLTQGGSGASPLPGPQTTRLLAVDAVTGTLTTLARVPGQVTSAVPSGTGAVAVRGADVIRVSQRGSVTTLASTAGQPYDLMPASDGGLGYLVAAGGRSQLWSLNAAGMARLIGSAPVGSVELSQVGGHVFVTGLRASRLGQLPPGWRPLDVLAGATVSSSGALAVTQTANTVTGASPFTPVPGQALPVQVSAEVTATHRRVTFTVPTNASRAGSAPTEVPASGARARPAAVNPATVTYDPDRSCSVPRNSPSVQTYQPSAQQIEWAADQAVQGKLTTQQPADLYGSGLPAFSPQGKHGYFPLPALDGGGAVPAQVLLGILALESNEDQASVHVVPGQVGNFEPSSNWYGGGGSSVDWAASDCGYGIAQVTSGMCRQGFPGCSDPMPAKHQLAVAVDFESNIAAGLSILVSKWNELHQAGITANGGNPSYVEDWYLALWDYNSGLEPNAANGNPGNPPCQPSPACTDSGGNWGLGWANNPDNPQYVPGRPMYLETVSNTVYNRSYDESHPGFWAYQEQAIGWGAFGFLTDGTTQAFARTSYPGNPDAAQPPANEFCSTAAATDNQCVPGTATTSGTCQLTTGPLTDHCWWHWPVTWVTCTQHCGSPVLTYQAGAPEPADPAVPAGYGPVCSASGLPAGALIVGTVPSSIPAPFGCGTSWAYNGGTMTWRFAADTATTPATYPSKIDFHQLGAGYGGHIWFTHGLRKPSTEKSLVVTGTWHAPASVTGSTTVYVSLPGEASVVKAAPGVLYRVALGNGTTDSVKLNQRAQTTVWVKLGTFDLTAGASVSLNNITTTHSTKDVMWGAVAFVPAG